MLAAGRVGYTASGSATTYAADGFWLNNSQSNYALVGGGWGGAALCGASCLDLNNAASNAHTNIGACHSYYSFTDNAPYLRYHMVEIRPIKEGASTSNLGTSFR